MKGVYTLRDLHRALDKNHKVVKSDRGNMYLLQYSSPWCRDKSLVSRAQVTKAISKYGKDAHFSVIKNICADLRKLEYLCYPYGTYFVFIPDTEEACQSSQERESEGECREKNTSEVAESNQQDGELHGGDGNSAEVESQAETDSDQARQSSQECEESESDETESAEARETDEDPENAEIQEEMLKEFLQDLSQSGRKSSHAVTTLEETAPVKDKFTIKLVNELQKLVDKEFGQGEMSPRIDGKKLIKELVSRRVKLSNAYKEELEVKRVLLMVDVSGSCSASAGGNLEACRAIYETNPDKVALVLHANGTPSEVLGYDPYEHAYSWDEDFIKSINYYTKESWALVINFGDDDALDHLNAMHEKGAKILVLDSYCARSGEAYESKRYKRKKNYLWVDGVNTSKAAWVGLKMFNKFNKD
jgi:hypothetical protein